jgi:phospholipid/cholesterol/gamma-HCH transport system substrate-binding protein
MRSNANKNRLLGLGLMAVVIVTIYLAATAISGVPAYPYHYVTATFATASNVVAHNDVRVNGARVGQVSKITYDPKTNLSHVTMQLQPGTNVHADASAAVGAVSSLGSEYISLDPGTAASGPAPKGGIPLDHTTTPVEIDAILNILGPTQAQAAASAIRTLGVGLGGRGPDLNTIISTSRTLLPNMGTTTATLADPAAGLAPLIQASNLLASRFQGRTQQLSALLGHMDTTFGALDTLNGHALTDTINTAAPALPAFTPALNSLSAVAGQARVAFADLSPGLAAAGSGTPDLRTFLRQGVSPLQKVPGVSGQAVPGFNKLGITAAKAEAVSPVTTATPVVPFLAELMRNSNPLLTYLAPYTVDMTNLWNTLTNGLSKGDVMGNWLPFSITVDGRTLNGNAQPGVIARCGYPAPDTSYLLKVPSGGCPAK